MSFTISTSSDSARRVPQPMPAPQMSTSFPCIGKDPLLERLVHALLPAAEANRVLQGYYTDALHATLLQRLERLRAAGGTATAAQGNIAIAEWRLRRVYNFIDQKMDERISLPALAAAAGLSRMHFAAVFRKATGLRPHDFVARRRIERAQHLLRDTSEPIVEISLSVGFQSQAHFTTVFRRLVGSTPHKWRLEQQALTGQGGLPN